MRDRRSKAFKGVVSILFLKYPTLEVDLVDMLVHILEVDCNCWVILIFYFLDSYHGVIRGKIWLLILIGSAWFSFRTVFLIFIDLTTLLIEIFFRSINHTIYYIVKADHGLISENFLLLYGTAFLSRRADIKLLRLENWFL